MSLAQVLAVVRRRLVAARGAKRSTRLLPPFIGRAVLVIFAASVLAGASWFLYPQDTPTFASVQSQWTPSDAYLLDRNGEVIDQERLDFHVRRFEWTPLDSVSPALLAAIVDAEDRHFWQHTGIDWSAILGALRDNGIAQRRRGASTISMQVIARLDPSVRAGYSRGAFMRKLEQLRRVRALEARWSKREILEAYVNLVDFRSEIQGISAASRVLAGKAPSGLSLSESLVLAALLPSPTAPPRAVATRACARAAARQLTIDCAAIRSTATDMLSVNPVVDATELHSLAAESAPHRTSAAARADSHRTDAAAITHGLAPRNALGVVSTNRRPMAVRLAPHLAHSLLSRPGERVRTTLDAEIQRTAIATLREHITGLASRNVRDGAVLVVDNDSGDVLAYVASSGPQSRAREVDGVRARRQAGSTLKPFLYEMALERRYLTSASLLNDSPITLDTASGIYLPQNYDRDFKGLVSVRTALGSSLNVPAVRALMIVGVEPFRERLHSLGYAGITEPGEFYGYSLALGSAEVSLWEQVQAYRTLARGGEGSPIQTRSSGHAGASKDRHVLASDATFIISDIISDRAARVVTFGLDNHLNTPFWSAVKTGTSKDMRDNWCIGFSRRFTVGVWIGNFEGDSMHDVSGVTGAAPVWQQMMLALHARIPSPAPPKPPGVTTMLARFSPAVESTRTELALSATGAQTIQVAKEIARIASPSNGMVIALDPDIPLRFQRVPLTARGADERMVLRLNGKALGAASHNVMWAPERGAYVLALEDSTGHTLDSARFIVR